MCINKVDPSKSWLGELAISLSLLWLSSRAPLSFPKPLVCILRLREVQAIKVSKLNHVYE